MEAGRWDHDYIALHGRIEHLELLLREADHRIANSLQLAAGIARLGAQGVVDPLARSRLLSTQQHIEAIAGVHQLLAVNEVTEALPLHEYLRRLITRLEAVICGDGLDRRIKLSTQAVAVPPEIAVWMGMIVIELVGNAVKYAYAADAPGEIRVSLQRVGGGFSVSVEDDGRGLASDRAPVGSGLGARMIDAMARRMNGDFRYEARSVGARAVFTCSQTMAGRWPQPMAGV